MSRPKPSVLLEIVEKETYKTEQVLASDGIWSVFYQGRPINLKTSNHEFIEWKWLDIESLPGVIVKFKKKVYEELLPKIRDSIN